MGQPTLTRAVQSLKSLARPKADVPDTDHELLTRFVQNKEDGAFRALVDRHGKIVLAACRQILSDPADIDDAFQATFLVLLKKAKRLDSTASLAGWLFAVAHRIAVRCRADNSRRRTREAEAANRARTSTDFPDLSWREAAKVVHDELNALPDKYRLPLLLCCLQGLTRDEAAEQLGTTLGAVRGQLERGRNLLERRLAKRGVVLSTGLLAFLLGSSRSAGGLPAELIERAGELATGPATAAVDTLAHGVIHMVMFKQLILTGMLTLCFLGAGISIGIRPAIGDEQPEMKKPSAATEAKAESTATPKNMRTITGRVLGHDGKPVQAELQMIWQEATTQFLGKTASDGTFKVSVPMKQGEYGGWLVAKAPGHGLDFQPHGMLWQPQTITPTVDMTFKLPKERTIKGRLIDLEGKPVIGATVIARSVSAVDSDTSADAHLKIWGTEKHANGLPPQSDRVLWFPMNAEMPTITSDKEGRFEISGFGAGQFVLIKVTGRGIANRQITTVNRDGFDPEPILKMTRASRPMYFARMWDLIGPDPELALVPEKVIRGRLVGPDGKPRAGVRVAFTRPNKRDLVNESTSATTDQDGYYEIRGAKKHAGYMVEVPSDPAAGLLQCQGFADDTVGYDPITIDMKQAKGVVISGRVINKSTGKPQVSQMWVEVLANNPFVDKYPPFMHAASMASEKFHTDSDGKFRIVTIPGPVIIMASPQSMVWGEFTPPVPDPQYPKYFHTQLGGLGFYGYGGSYGIVQGNWCKVIEPKDTDTELSLDVQLIPAIRTPLKVIDAAGKPLTGSHAGGVTYVDFDHPVETTTDTHTVFNLEPKVKRLVAVIHKQKKLVGTIELTKESTDSVVKLDIGGSVSGRVMTPDGKPMSGVNVMLVFTRRAAQEAYNLLNAQSFPTTNDQGEFRLESLFPGEEFKLFFKKGQQRLGHDHDKATKHIAPVHGETLKLGDLKLESANDE